MAYDAVLRNRGVIGEAVRALPPETRDAMPDVPWASIAGMRHIVVHEYFRVNLELILDIVDDQLGPLAPSQPMTGCGPWSAPLQDTTLFCRGADQSDVTRPLRAPLTNTGGTDDRQTTTPDEEYDFYARPENQEPQGPPRRRIARLTAPIPVLFPPELLEEMRRRAGEDDRSVSSWIRRAVEHELQRPA